jgi:hypothetical protein
MEEFRIPDKLVRLMKATIENSQCQVKVQSELLDPVRVMNGLRQGDLLACLLFSIALEKVIRDSGIQTRGTIFYKSMQILASADDIDIIGRSEDDIKKSCMTLKTAADAMGLRVNEEKTKYMIVNGRKIHRTVESHIKITCYKFERVHRFVYLGSLVNETSDIQEEISRQIKNANKCYHGL